MFLRMQLFNCPVEKCQKHPANFSALSANAKGKRRFFNFLIFARSWELARWLRAGSIEFVGNISLSSASSPSPSTASSVSTMLTIGMRPLFFSPTVQHPAPSCCCCWQWAKFIHLENLLIFFACVCMCVGGEVVGWIPNYCCPTCEDCAWALGGIGSGGGI